MLCGKDRCPILMKHDVGLRTRPLIDSLELEGSSPPGVFVGRYNYPKVFVGPMIPPVRGDTMLMDTPEMWVGRPMEEIVSFRSQLVRGKYRLDVHDVEGGGRIGRITREIAMAKHSPDLDAAFSKKPVYRIRLDDEIQPMGPSAPLAALDAGNIRLEPRIEKASADTDLKAADAVLELHRRGIPVSQIQKSFSVGSFGLGQNRKFVPTRWSITAVDSIIGASLMERTRDYPLINEHRVYYYEALDNRWAVLMMPREWCYELIEAWYPKTVWNPDGKEIYLVSDSEFYNGRKAYAQIGGCYYAARLAVNEMLNAERRQAGVVIFREAHPGYIMPVGVWNVREHVRAALKTAPQKFQTLDSALSFITSKMDIKLQRWICQSDVLRNSLYQRKLGDYIGR
jgi:hypothetical protein